MKERWMEERWGRDGWGRDREEMGERRGWVSHLRKIFFELDGFLCFKHKDYLFFDLL
jgi:hypothetical protein